MIRFGLALFALTFGLAVAPAYGVSIVDEAGNTVQPYQAWADALPATPDVTIKHETGLKPCRGKMACAWPGNLRIGCTTGRRCRISFAHEMGHHVAFSWPSWKWRVFGRIVNPPSDLLAQEWLAVGYSLCALSTNTGFRYRVSDQTVTVHHYGYEPTRREHRRVCKLLHT